MKTSKALDLSLIDGRRQDGLLFCRRAYKLLERIQKEPNGISRLRHRGAKLEKRLIEEVLPLARYIQMSYREGLHIDVQWFSGSQRYDAILFLSGGLVKHGMAPARVLVEVTTSVHPNDHLRREILDEGRPSFGVKGLSRDAKTRKVLSRPVGYRNSELANDLAEQVLSRLTDKSTKQYPPGTVLLINCETDTLILEDEWNDAVELVKDAKAHIGFREVNLIDAKTKRIATLYGDRKTS